MHDARSHHVSDDATGPRAAAESGASVHVPATRPAGDLTVLERLEAFRDLIRHGNVLLGEVVAYCHDAEAAVAQIAAEKQDIDRVRAELQDATNRAEAEANATRSAMAQVDAQRRELNEMRAELLAARAEVGEFQRNQDENAAALEQRLQEAREQQKKVEEELQRVRSQTASSRTLDNRLGQVEQMEARLRLAERELTDTRRALEDERSRRDRAIALIKPRQVAGEARA